MNVFVNVVTIPQQPEAVAKERIEHFIQHPGNMKDPKTISAWVNGEGKYAGEREGKIEEEYRKTAFDMLKGQIFCISVLIDEEEKATTFWDSGILGDNESHEKEMLENFVRHIPEPPTYDSEIIWVGHYLQSHLKAIFQRCAVHGVMIPSWLNLNHHWSKHGDGVYDTMYAWGGYGNTIGLDALYYGLFDEENKHITDNEVWDRIRNLDIDSVQDYSATKVHRVRKICHRLWGV